MPITKAHRYTADRPCPICGGFDRMPRGQGQRCFGFLSEDGQWAHCTRPELAGRIAQNPQSQTYPHRLSGDCPCGQQHGSALPPPPRPVSSATRRPGPNAPRGRLVATYDYQDETGALRYQQCRYEPKTFALRRPDPKAPGEWVHNLQGVTTVLFRLPQLAASDPAAQVVIVEGEKAVLAAERLGLLATCSPMGAGKWRERYNASVAGHPIVIVPDNDDPGRLHAEQVAGHLAGHCPNLRIVTLPGLPEHGDIHDWVESGGTRAELDALIAATPAPTSRPKIVINGRDLRDIVADCARAVQAGNAPPRLFVRGGVMTRVRIDEKGRPMAEPVTVPGLQVAVSQAANVRKLSSMSEVPAILTTELARAALDSQDWPSLLPPLAGITQSPVVTHAGAIEPGPGQTGYLPQSQLWHHGPAADWRTASPMTQESVNAARAFLLDEILRDFPFVDAASRANAVALLILPFARPLISGPTPLHLIDAPTPGTGKGLLAEVLVNAYSPSGAAFMPVPKTPEEWGKVFTSILLAGAGHIILDNVNRKLQSDDLCTVLTTGTWPGRILGQSKMAYLDVSCVWIATGNNLVVSDEIARRSVWIRLDPETERPWHRTGFRHDDLRAWSREHRSEIIRSVLTLIMAWVEVGMPPGRVRGSFESWSKVIDGIMKTSGIPGFLDNEDALYDTLDFDRQAWLAFYAAWWAKHQSNPVGVKDLFPLASSPDKRGPDMFDTVPAAADLLGHLLGDGNERSRTTMLGRLLRARLGRVMGGFRFKSAGVAHQAAQYVLEQIPQEIQEVNGEQ